jgi:pyruvate/2-oxoglutarate dehydrogenase complex dihydrolipoamide acyltransferase (E2) component
MKLSDDEFDEKALDGEYEGPQFERYTGEIPRSGTILTARVTKGWFLFNDDGDSQIKVIAVAEQNNGSTEEFNGLPTWETMTFKDSSKSRYLAFLSNFGLTVRDVKRKLFVKVDDDRIGTPIEKIGDWEIGSDDALCRIIIKRDNNLQGELRSNIDWDGWLPYDEAEADADEPDDDDDEEEAAPPPRRGARRTAAATPASRPAARRRAAEPEPDDDEDEDEPLDDDLEDDDGDEVETAPPARGRSRQAANGRASRPAARAAARTATRSGTSRTSRSASRASSQDDPPF